ncbi:sodium/solute symporter [Crocinitomix catalasitica]|nr:sodium/solute symporter [Crocinitomix catalasitica]
MKRIGLIIFTLSFFTSWAGDTLKGQLIFEPFLEISHEIQGAFVGTDGKDLFVGGGRVDGYLSDTIYQITSEGEISNFNGIGLYGYRIAVSSSNSIYFISHEHPQGTVIKLTDQEVTPLQTIPGLPDAKGGVVLNDQLYVFGIGENNLIRFLKLDLSKENAEWEELDAPQDQNLTTAKICVQHSALYVFGESGSAWSYRPVPLDGTKEKGWIDIQDGPKDFVVENCFAMGQGHIMLTDKNGEVFAYHTITDTWVQSSKAQGYQSGQIINWNNETVLVIESEGKTVIKKAKYEAEIGVLQTWDYIMIALYAIILLVIGAYFSKRAKTSEEYFLGGRRIPWWAVGISLYATGTSAISFLAIPTKSYVTNQVHGVGSLWGPIFIVLVAFLMIPLLRGLNMTSIYEYLEKRFNVAIRMMGAFFSVAFQLGGRMSIVLLLPALALSAVTGIDKFTAIAIMGIIATVYTVLGGISAVIWTDVIQVVILLGGAVLALFMMINGTEGGLGGFVDINMQYEKFEGFQWGWDFTLPVFWVFILNQMMAQFITPADQVMMQRVQTTPSVKSARKSFIFLGVIVVPGTLIFFLLGSSLFSFFHSNPEMLNPNMENIQTFPLYIVEALPTGVAGLLIAALFAACMSTLDSSMNSVSTVVLTDFYKRFKPEVSEKKVLKLAKLITIVVGVLGTLIALGMATLDIKSIFDLWMKILALITGVFGGIFLLGIFTKRANSGGALIGLGIGIIATLVVSLNTPVHFMLYSTVSVLTCFIMGYLGSFFFRPTPNDLTGLTVFTRSHRKNVFDSEN